MKTEILKETPEKIELKFKDASINFLNSLRRTVLSELPCFAVDEVDFFENTSTLYNEYLASRMGLIPLTWEEGVSDDAKIVFTLEREGPATVYSRDLVSTDEKIRVFYEGIPLIKLGGGQKLKLEATAVKGTAKKHAKFQCAIASYGFAEAPAKDGKRKEEYKFLVESYNNVPAKQHLVNAIQLLEQRADLIKKEVK